MTKVFMDIGAHIGESIEIALRKQYGFDVLIAVEPSSYGISQLMKFKEPRLRIVKLALGARKGTQTLFGAGSVGGSLFKDKRMHWQNEESVEVESFSTWFKSQVTKEDRVWIKLNVEGSELEIVEEMRFLTDYRIESLLIDFDVEKVPSRRGKKSYIEEVLRQDLTFSYFERNCPFTVESWLNLVMEAKSLGIADRLTGIWDFKLPFFRNLRRLAKPLIPERIWLKLALTFGPNRRNKF